MKNLFLFFFAVALIVSEAHSQIISGQVTYKMELDFHPTNESKNDNAAGVSHLRAMIERSKKSMEGLRCILDFNQSTSHFHLEKRMENDGNPGLRTALTLLNVTDDIFSDLQEGITRTEKKAFGKNYLVEDSIQLDWTITAESKQIGNFTVYKAESFKETVNSKGKFRFPVTAWFAPEIPFSFGPIGYGGLPGLILELEVSSNFPVRYVADKLKFSENTLKISSPKGELITNAELQELYTEARRNSGRR